MSRTHHTEDAPTLAAVHALFAEKEQQLRTRLVLTSLWAATMLTYLLGDVLRLMSGDQKPGQLFEGQPNAGWMWLLIACIMLIPILMIVCTPLLRPAFARNANIAVAIFLIGFNLIGLPYKGAYDNFLIAVSLMFNLLTMGIAWKWHPETI